MAAKKKAAAQAKRRPARAAKREQKRELEGKAKKQRLAVDLAARMSEVDEAKAKEYPDQPVGVATAMGTRMAELGKTARSKLAKLYGFELRYLDELPAYVAQLQRLELAWQAARADGRSGVGPAVVKAAEELKSEMFGTGRYLLRKKPKIQAQLDEIAQGTGLADTALDLRKLAEIVRAHEAIFLSDESFPRNAAAQADDYAEQLERGLEPVTAAEALAARNRAFWLLDEAIDEVRAALRQIWRKQPPKLALLGDTYSTKLSKKSREKTRAAVVPSGGGGPAPVPA